MTSTNERNENVNCFANQCQNSFIYLVAFIYCYKLDFEQMNILISDFFFLGDKYCFSCNGGTQT